MCHGHWAVPPAVVAVSLHLLHQKGFKLILNFPGPGLGHFLKEPASFCVRGGPPKPRGQLSQSVNCIPYKHEDLSSSPELT